MLIEQACESILGEPLAHAIIDSMGVHWAVVAAMEQAQLPRDFKACEAIDAWLEKEKGQEVGDSSE